jgi:glycosyltransferase involved in cell wall biosynthesis
MTFSEFKERYQREEVVHYPSAVSDKPFVSVCVTTYQHSQYIRQCLDSLLAQVANFDYEILIGEDGSNDGTREICMEYAQRHADRVRLFLNARGNNIFVDGKPSGRFNFLYTLLSAKGKYVALCEGDDYWTEPNKLMLQVACLENDASIQMCFHDAFFNRERKNVNRFTDRFPFLLNKQCFITGDILSNKWFIPTASMVFRNRLAIPFWFCDVKGGDYALIYLNSLLGRIEFLNFLGSAYRINEGGIANQPDVTKRLISRKQEIKVYLRNLPWKYKSYALRWYISVVRRIPLQHLLKSGL